MEPVRLGIVGVDSYADILIELLVRSDRFQLVAICDRRPEVLRRYDQPGCGWELFDDPREMILRSGLHVLVVWRDSDRDAFQTVAIEKGIWLVQRRGSENSLDAAGKLLRLGEKAGVGLLVWSPWLFVPSFESTTEWLTDQQTHSVSVRFAASDRSLDWPERDRPLTALTYPSIFCIQKWLGLPESVFCREQIRATQDADNPIDYHCSLDLAYPHSLASVSASLNSGPDRYDVAIHTAGGMLELRLDQARWFDSRGSLITSSEAYPIDQAHRMSYERALNALWQSYQEHQRSPAFELKRHLGVMAILEAAALSARTGAPEQLSKVAELSEIIPIG